MRLWRISILVLVIALVAVAAAVALNHRDATSDRVHRAEVLAHGNAERGEALFQSKGCGGCHTMSGVKQAAGLVGPPLDGVGRRAVIAGVLENTPDNLARWIRTPQQVVPGNAMPNLPMTEQDSRDLAAFLYATG